MKKLILIILVVIASAMFTNVHASNKVSSTKNNSSQQVKFVEEGTAYIITNNGSLYLLVVYPSGGYTLTYLGPQNGLFF